MSLEAAKLFSTLKHVIVGLDEDASGTIDVEEFGHAYKKLNAGASDADVATVFKTIDVNGDGSISLEELALYYGMRVTDGQVADGVDISGMSDQQKAELLALEKATA